MVPYLKKNLPKTRPDARVTTSATTMPDFANPRLGAHDCTGRAH